jgi:hypothetical protein
MGDASRDRRAAAHTARARAADARATPHRNRARSRPLNSSSSALTLMSSGGAYTDSSAISRSFTDSSDSASADSVVDRPLVDITTWS